MAIEKALNAKAMIDHQAMQPGGVERTFANISLAKRELGYDPRVDLTTGSKRFVDWFRKEQTRECPGVSA